MSNNRPDKQATLSDLIGEFSEAIQSNPQDAFAYFNRGMIYSEQGNVEQADEDYKKAIQLEPELRAQVKSYMASKQHLGDNLKKITSDVLAGVLSSYHAASDLHSLTQANKSSHKLFKPALALNQLLNLVVRYEFDEKK